MPTYDYKCSGCRRKFEAFQSISAEPLTECPKCGGEVQRQIGGGAGFLFKGSGFYQTDYGSSDYKKAADSDKKDKAPAKKVEKSASNKDAKKAL